MDMLDYNRPVTLADHEWDDVLDTLEDRIADYERDWEQGEAVRLRMVRDRIVAQMKVGQLVDSA